MDYFVSSSSSSFFFFLSFFCSFPSSLPILTDESVHCRKTALIEEERISRNFDFDFSKDQEKVGVVRILIKCGCSLNQ